MICICIELVSKNYVLNCVRLIRWMGFNMWDVLVNGGMGGLDNKVLEGMYR